MREEFEKTNGKRKHRTPKYRVLLSAEQRKRLGNIIDDTENDYQKWRAKVILALDEGQFAPGVRLPYDEIASEIGIALPTVGRTAKRFVQLGLERALNAHFTAEPFGPDEQDRLRDLVEQGGSNENLTVRHLAREFGRSQNTICKALRHLREEKRYEKPLTELGRQV